MRLDEIADAIAMFKRMTRTEGRTVTEATTLVAEHFNRSESTIKQLLRRFSPSIDGAKAYMEANALKLAMRVVRKAGVDQAIDILSRPNMGVLEPLQDRQAGGGGFFLSVQAEHLGAVKVVGGMAPLSQGPSVMLTPPSGPQPLDMGSWEQPALEIGERQREIPPSATSSVASGTDDDEEKGPPMTTPGVPHKNQGTFRGRNPADRPKFNVGAYKRRLTEARRLAQLKNVRELGKKIDEQTP